MHDVKESKKIIGSCLKRSHLLAVAFIKGYFIKGIGIRLKADQPKGMSHTVTNFLLDFLVLSLRQRIRVSASLLCMTTFESGTYE